MKLFRFRRLVQVAVLALFVALPWLNRAGFTEVRGSLFAFDLFGVPFADPLGAVQVALAGIIPGWRLVAGGLLALGLALCLGRVFCSWLCPFGLLSELVYTLRRKGFRPQKPRPFGGFRSRAAVVVVGLALVPVLGIPLLNQLSLPGGLSLGLLGAALPLSAKTVPTLPEQLVFLLLPFVPVLLVLVVEAVTGRRLWCRWLCPQSVLLALMARLPLAPRLQRTLTRCTCKSGKADTSGKAGTPDTYGKAGTPDMFGKAGTPACRVACPLGLDPRNPRSSSPLECTNCGACVLACSRVHAGEPAALRIGKKP